MRRDVLRRAINRVVADLLETGVANLWSDAIRATRPSSVKDETLKAEWFDLSVFQAYMLRTSTYGEAERLVMTEMDFERLLDAKFWQSVVRDIDREVLFNINNSIRFATTNLPRLASLLDRGYPDPELPSSDGPPSFEGKTILRLILSEDEERYSSVERLILAISSVQDLYDVINRINNIAPEKILVLGIDSGSDKLFDFLGLSAAMAEAKEILLGLYDRIAFGKHASAAKTVSNIAESLPVFQKIADLEQSSGLSAEEAELLRRKLIGSLTNFVDSGAVIPEMERVAAPEPRMIMRPQPKLLSAPVDLDSHERGAGSDKDSTKPTSGGARESSPRELTEEQIAELEALLQHAREQRENTAEDDEPVTPAPRRGRPRKAPE